MTAIEARGLTKVFNARGRSVVAVDHVSFTVEEGEVFGFLGPNGAGKTTTLRMLCTLLRPSGGTAEVMGFDVVKQPDEVRRVIGVVFQDPALDDQLTGRENLDFHARMYGLDRRTRQRRIREVLELVGLESWADELVKNYSGGMKRRLELARGLMHFPRVLFLDEPTLGLDVQSRRAMWSYIAKLNKEEGVTVFLTTNYLEEVDALARRVAIIDRGRIVAEGSPSKLKDLMGEDVITVSCRGSEGLAEALSRLDWVKSVKELDGGRLSIYVEHGEDKIPTIVKLAEQLGVVVLSVNLRRPSLEDVFIHLTDRNLHNYTLEK